MSDGWLTSVRAQFLSYIWIMKALIHWEIKMCFIFTCVEYVDIIFSYGFCDRNACAAANEYRRNNHTQDIQMQKIFYRVYQHLREKGSFPFVCGTAERHGREDEVRNSVRMAVRAQEGFPLGWVFLGWVWRTLRNEGTYPYHLQKIQQLIPEDFHKTLEFCHWLEHPHLCKYILFTDEAVFTCDGTQNIHYDHWWSEENPLKTLESNFQQ